MPLIDRLNRRTAARIMGSDNPRSPARYPARFRRYGFRTGHRRSQSAYPDHSCPGPFWGYLGISKAMRLISPGWSAAFSKAASFRTGRTRWDTGSRKQRCTISSPALSQVFCTVISAWMPSSVCAAEISLYRAFFLGGGNLSLKVKEMFPQSLFRENPIGVLFPGPPDPGRNPNPD